ncbi:uncharacterized protein LOC134815817 isoform X2 [Bolinopsis microptera]|uniref:uncharacterized protein LOC134815817 isoform X2 n=1 Tax=Bolinopsis microptera TaxID=2820187 RepID=UPI003078D548
MENGNTLNNINETRFNGLISGTDKMTVVYKVPPYSHPNKRPIQSVGGTSSQGNSVTMMEGRGQHMSGTVPTIIQQTSPQPNNIPQLHSQQTLYSTSPNKVPQAQKMVLQLQRDPKTGNLMMLNNQPIRPQTVIQMDNQGGPATGQQQAQQVANHGYHPGRHLHHQLQLKHLPQGGGPGVTQLTHAPVVQQASPQRPQIIQPRPPQAYQQQAPRPQQQSYQPNYENMTYTRTYPQTNQQSYQYNYQTLRPVTRYVTPQYQQHMLVQNNMRPGTQTVAPAQVMTSQPRFPFQNHVLSTSRAVTTERLSHFDYGEQDEVSNNRPGFPRTSSYQQVIENEDKSTLRVSHAGHVPSYNPVFVGPQPAQIIGQLRPNQTFVSQPNIISTQSSTHFRATSVQQPYVVRNQIRNSAPLQQTAGLPNRAPNVVATPAQSSSTDYSAVRPVILTAQQAGQTFQSSPVVVQINGGKSIRGSIVSLNTQQQQQQQQQQPQQPAKQINPATSTHVYFTIPQGNGAAKFIKTPNGHLRPVNGVAIQNSLSQSKMYTVRYVNPKSEDGKTKQFTIYSPIAPSNNNSSKPSEKILLPKGGTLSAQEQNRKRKLTPTKAGISSSQQPNKLTRIEPKPHQTAASSQHNELIQRVNKSLEGDREAVQRPDCNTPFESFPDAFRKLMKYHIFFEPDTKDSYLKRVDKLHDEVSQKLDKRKENLFNKYYSRIMADVARPMPNYAESSVAVSLLQQKVPQDKEELQELKDEIRKAKADKAREEQRESENISPDPEGEFD